MRWLYSNRKCLFDHDRECKFFPDLIMPVLVDYSSIQTLPEIWRIAADRFSNTCALDAPHNDPQIRWSYAELYQRIQLFASGLQALGISPQAGEPLPPRLALFADNSPRWFV
ncbi:MAG: hypothetical protein ACO3NK_09635, partial [Prochlorotrichaceae cyanobacterium]